MRSFVAAWNGRDFDRFDVLMAMPYRGTFTHTLMGIRPTRRFAEVDEMVIFRIHDGRIAQAWAVYDESGMWRQLGVTPAATAPAGA